MIWPFKSKETASNAAGAGSDNNRLKQALQNHESQRTPQSHLVLLKQLNSAHYLAAAQDGAVKYQTDSTTGLRSIDPESRFKILLAGSPSGEPLLALFTDYAELETWSKGKATASWSFSAQEAWVFAKSVSVGIIVNPTSAGWVIGLETIEWLQKYPS